MKCAECGALCDFVDCVEDKQHAKPDIDHLDFKSNSKPECVSKGKRCGVLNYNQDVCIIELESEEIRDIASNEIKTIRKFSVKPCGNEDAESEIYEVIE